MNLKKKLREFLSLARRRDGGFTLIELIVVIAIIAILGGVGVPAYSGYIEKTNMGADRTLVGEVKHALSLGYYSGKLPNGGSVVLSTDKAPQCSDEVKAVLIASFGENLDGLKLKYDGWTDASKMLNLVDNAYAGSVNDSTYITNVGTDKLLSDVQYCATSFGSFLNKLHSGDKTAATNSLINGFEDQSAIKGMLADAGYKTEADYANVSPEVLQNLTVLGVASAVNKDQSSVVNSFATGSALGTPVNKDMNLDEIAQWYASAEALVAYLDDESCNEAFYYDEEKQTGINLSSGDALVIAQNMNGAYTRIQEVVKNDPNLATKLNDYYTKTGTNGKTQAQVDGEAYVGIMTGVNGLGGEYLADENALKNGNLFGGGTLDNRVDSFVTAADLVGKMDDDTLQTIRNAEGSAVLVSAYEKNGTLECTSLPRETDVQP